MESSNNNTDRGKKKRRWLQFGLRTIFFLFILTGVAFGFLTNEAKRTRREAEALFRLQNPMQEPEKQQPGSQFAPIVSPKRFHRAKPRSNRYLPVICFYNYQVDEKGAVRPHATSGNPQWLRDWIGENAFAYVHTLVADRIDSNESAREISNFKKLKEIRLLDCDKLHDISFLLPLSRLESTTISYCRQLKSLDGLSDSIHNLVLEYCDPNIDVSRLKDLTSLRSLRMSGVSGIKDLRLLSKMQALEELDLSTVANLESLDGIENLKSLKVLRLSACESLRNINAIRHHPQLEELTIFRCHKLESLDGMEVLKNLSDFALSDCSSLKHSQDVAVLRHLDSLEKLSFRSDAWDDSCELPDATCIQVLELHSKSLSSLIGMPHYPKLTNLSVAGNPLLTSLDGLQNCPSLTRLHFANCPNLVSLKGIESLSNLETILGSECGQIKDLDALSNLTKLTYLDLTATEAQSLAPFAKLKMLQHAEFGITPDVTSFNELAGLTSLKDLWITRLHEHSDLSAFHALDQLTSLLIRQAPDMVSLNGVSKMKSLESLSVYQASKLSVISDCLESQTLKSVRLSAENSISKSEKNKVINHQSLSVSYGTFDRY